jgi:hypothetical protein
MLLKLDYTSFFHPYSSQRDGIRAFVCSVHASVHRKERIRGHSLFNKKAFQVFLSKTSNSMGMILRSVLFALLACVLLPALAVAQQSNGTLGANTLNLYNPKGDRSRSVFDLPQRFVGTLLYDVPFFNKTRGVVELLANGFQLSTIVTAQSGAPAGVSDSALLTGTGMASRPDVNPGQSLYAGRTYKQWFNPSAFQQAAWGTFGNSNRCGAVRLPGLLDEDSSAVKGFKMGEERNLQLGADIFNLWRRYNANPSAVSLARNSASFGQLGGGGSDTASRIVQLSGKFYF